MRKCISRFFRQPYRLEFEPPCNFEGMLNKLEDKEKQRPGSIERLLLSGWTCFEGEGGKDCARSEVPSESQRTMVKYLMFLFGI